MKLVLALALVIASTAQASTLKDIGIDFNNIIGGTEVQPGALEAASTVLLVGKEGEGNFICSGSLIDKDIVLTAAHCLGTDGLAPVVVVFRTTIKGEGPVYKTVDRRRMSDFLDRAGNNATDWHDVALLKLEKPAPANYTPAKFLPSADMLKVGGSVTLAGYGMTTPVASPGESDDGAGTLRKVDQTVLNNKLGDTEFLVSLAGGKGACHGDSGGPAFVRNGSSLFLIGIASRMTEADRVANNGDANDFSCSVDMVYTSALGQMDWIKTNWNQLHGH